MSAESGESSSLQGKTPISYLQELCNKRGITPQYDLIANEGAVHEPLFVFKVTAGEYMSTGKGTSKKKAKHNAAISVLSQMGDLPGNASGSGGAHNSTPSHFNLETKDVDARNPVGELQEMTQKKSWPPPVYEFTSEIGPAHAREFVCTVQLFNVCEQAVGKSKKLAKRNAAIAMLETIQQGGVEPKMPAVELEDPYVDEETIPLYDTVGTQRLQSSQDAVARNSAGDGEVDRVRKKISPMFQPASKKTKLGPLLEALQITSDDDLVNSDLLKKLEDLGREQKFSVNYVDMPELSISGKHQCIVELSTNPVTACFGSSEISLDDAHIKAALNALRHCKIMTTRTTM